MSPEVLQEFCTDIPGFIPKTGIEGRLAATGLFCIVFHLYPGLLQHFHHIESRLGEKLVDKAWYEQLNCH
jgi:hypothetical protein